VTLIPVLSLFLREKDFRVVFSEAYPIKVEEIPPQQVSRDFSIAESHGDLAYTELFVLKLYTMGGCHDIGSRGRTEVNPLAILWL
jgi:hypothetical protein